MPISNKVQTNIPIIRKPFGAELPPRVPYIDENNVGADDQFVYIVDKKIVPSTKSLGGLKNGKKYFLYMQDGKLKDDMPASSVSITPQGDGTTTIASFTIDGVTGYIKAGSGGGTQSINNLDVPLLTPMFFDYDYRQSGDEICWIPAIHYNEGSASTAGSLGYKSMYFGRHQCTATTDTTPSTGKTYYIMDTSIGDYRECIASDFNNDGSFKSGTTYYEISHRGYRLIYNHLVADFDAAGSSAYKTKTYTLSSTGESITIGYRLTMDGHKIIKCTTDASVAEIADKLDALYNDAEIGTAWYYVIDTNRKMFRLPRTRYGLHGDKTYVKTAQEGNVSLNLYFHTGNRDDESNSRLVLRSTGFLIENANGTIKVRSNIQASDIPSSTGTVMLVGIKKDSNGDPQLVKSQLATSSQSKDTGIQKKYTGSQRKDSETWVFEDISGNTTSKTIITSVTLQSTVVTNVDLQANVITGVNVASSVVTGVS